MYICSVSLPEISLSTSFCVAPTLASMAISEYKLFQLRYRGGVRERTAKVLLSSQDLSKTAVSEA